MFDQNGFKIKSGYVIVYHYSEITGEYSGETNEYINSGASVPAHSTIIKPPASKTGYAIIFDKKSKDWTYVIDYRGKTIYNKLDLSETFVFRVGEIDSEYTLLKPSTKYDKWDGEKWVTDFKAKKDGDIKDAEQVRKDKIDGAMASISFIKLKLDAGRKLKEAERNKLNIVIDYVDLLNDLDLSTAPDVKWPPEPNF